MNLNEIKKLKAPLQFVYDKSDPERRPLGIVIKETSPDGKTERLHRFDSYSGIYSGYRDSVFDEGTELMLSDSGVEYEYKGKIKGGKNRYWRKRMGRIYQVEKKRAVSEESLPYLIDEDGIISLGRPEKLPTLHREPTARERLEAQAQAEGRTLAEIYADRDGSLEDDPSEQLLEEPTEKVDESSQSQSDEPSDQKFDEHGQSHFDFDEPSNPER